MSDRRPDVRVHSDECEHNDQWDSCERATPADLLAAVRRAVESGQIEGEVTKVDHDYYDHHASDGNLVKAGTYLVIPIGGSE